MGTARDRRTWRVYVPVDREEIEIIDLDTEDYHRAKQMATGSGSGKRIDPDIRREIIEPLELSVTSAAKVLDMSATDS